MMKYSWTVWNKKCWTMRLIVSLCCLFILRVLIRRSWMWPTCWAYPTQWCGWSRSEPFKINTSWLGEWSWLVSLCSSSCSIWHELLNCIIRGNGLLEQDGLSPKVYFPLSAALDKPLLWTPVFTNHTHVGSMQGNKFVWGHYSWEWPYKK